MVAFAKHFIFGIEYQSLIQYILGRIRKGGAFHCCVLHPVYLPTPQRLGHRIFISPPY